MRGLRCLAAGVAVAWLTAAGYSRAGEVADDDPLVRSAHQAIAGALNTALERARSNQAVPWADPGTDLTGSITVYKSDPQGGRPCRTFKYVVHDSLDELIDRGLYCRDQSGLWRMAGVPDLLDKHPVQQTRIVDPVPPPPPGPALLQLQENLARLAYGATPAENSVGPGFDDALTAFEADEGMRRSNDPEAIRHALALSTATLDRSASGGVCAAPDGETETTLVCGRRR